MAKEDSILQDKTSPIDREALQEPPLFKVLLHNDDYTTMDFVIMVLVTVFGKNSDEATRIMLNVHHQGIGLAACTPGRSPRPRSPPFTGWPGGISFP